MTYKELAITNIALCTVILASLAIFILRENTPEVKAARDYSAQYKFTNPILDYENVEMEHTYFIGDRIQSKVEDLKEKYGLSFASVYFRDLNNGQWIGINEKEQFTTASLIKIPILIGLLREEEVRPGTLTRAVTVSSNDFENAAVQDIKPERELLVGETYTLLELAERMTQESDNISMKILINNIDRKFHTSIFESVGVAFKVGEEDIMVKVKDYAGFFRVLFNASYLSRENSELALDMLSKTKYDRGIVAGVPKGVVVSHKFGERSNYLDSTVVYRQLHDCGIIYYPQKPYILCVMTRGSDYENQSSFIREVSKLFYTEIEKRL